VIAPPAETIESAIDQLQSRSVFVGREWVILAQQNELRAAMPNVTAQFMAGYQLGIQTARVLLAGMPAAIANKVSI
jgi:hypothetical protein